MLNPDVPPFSSMPAFFVYLLLEFVGSLSLSAIFTANMIYQITVAGLTPLQLVLVGTTLETVIFLFEIPTGVLADVKSRRLSVIIGYLIMGSGFVLEGSLPAFWAIALAQGIWGLGYTFTSGATQAWVADDVGEKLAGQAFVRGAQAASAGGLLGIGLGVALGRVNIQLPIVLGGLGLILLAVLLIFVMKEEGFKPVERLERSTWHAMLGTIKEARQLSCRQPVLLVLLAIGLFYGLYCEGLDRLWTAHLLENFTAPFPAGVEAVVWIGGVRAVTSLLGIGVQELVHRRLNLQQAERIARVLLVFAAGIVLALAGFGLARSFWLAVGLYVLISVLRGVTHPLQTTWINLRVDDPEVRATTFSVYSQVDAIGQIAGGPVVGWIGNASIRAALVTAGLVLAPVLPLYRLAQRSERDASTL